MRRLAVVVVLVLAGALWGATQVLGHAAPAAATDTGSLEADFNHDGFTDLAVGTPQEAGAAGAVNVLYGSADGLSGAGSRYLTQNTAGVASLPQGGDQFGWALAAGDFDRDGVADLAVGVPGEDVGSIFGAGAVQVLYGSAGGLSGSGSQLFTQDTPGVGSSAENNDRFGLTLAAAGP